MVSVDRAWNTWDANVPSKIVHLPSGFEIRVSFFDGDLRVLEDFQGTLARGDSHIELGPHATDGEFIEFTLFHGGTHVDVAVAKATAFSLVGTVRFREVTMWNAHRWINLEVGYSDDGRDELDSSTPTHVLDDQRGLVRFAARRDAVSEAGIPQFASSWRSQEFRVGVSERPTHSDLYANLNELRDDYIVRGSGFVRAETPGFKSWGAFRFIVEGTSSFEFAVAQDIDGHRAESTVRENLSQAHELIEEVKERVLVGSESSRAVRDIIGWNTIWEKDGARAYTCLTRNWMRMLGGRGVWLTDVMYNGLLAASVGDWDLANANIDAVLSGQQANGIVPGLISGNTEWVDRTQFPVLSYIVWRTYLLSGDKVALERFYPVLRRYHEWHYASRDGNKNGVLEHGSDRVGLANKGSSRWAAINESGMDNLPVFDEATFVAETGTLDFEEVGHNSMLVLGIEMLSLVARELGRTVEADELQSEYQRVGALVRDRLWDEARQIFAGRLWSGEFARHLSPTSFYPLAAGIATDEQAKVIIETHLLNPEEFWGEIVIPTTPFNDPTSLDNAYWRGRVWPPLNFMVWEGLRRYGYWDEARELAGRSWKIFEQGWSSRRHAHENYQINPVTDCDWLDSDQFYSWGAMMPLMEIFQSAEVNPWHGVVLTPGGDPAVLNTPGRRSELQRDDSDGALELVLNGKRICCIHGATSLSHVVISDCVLSFRAKRASNAGVLDVVVIGRGLDEIVGVFVDGHEEESSPQGEGTRITVGGDSYEVDLEIHLRPRGEANRV
jgi:putative isomerase